MKRKTINEVVRQEGAFMVALQRRLMDAGLIATAAAVNVASQKLGYEAAKLMERK